MLRSLIAGLAVSVALIGCGGGGGGDGGTTVSGAQTNISKGDGFWFKNWLILSAKTS